MARLKFNKKPHFDTYTEESGYQQVLYSPGKTIQARELNESSAMMLQKVESIGNHLFKFGSVVNAGSVKLNVNVQYVRLNETNESLVPANLSFMSNNHRYKVKGVSSGLIASIIHTSDGDEYDPVTLYINYENTAIDGQTYTFINGEILQFIDDKGFVVYSIKVRCPTCPNSIHAGDSIHPTGVGTLFSISESSYYIYGNFVSTKLQTIILEKYDNRPSFKVGFDIIQSVVTSQDDTTLNDNAIGTTNFSAPGADRYKIELVLNKKLLDNTDDENFIMLAKVEVGVLKEVNDRPQYSQIMDMISRRTYDESGNYTVTPYRLNFGEHLAPHGRTMEGYKTVDEGGDTNKFIMTVSPGKSYVYGREVEHIAETILEVPKARESIGKRINVIRPVIGNYIIVKLDTISNLLPTSDVRGVDTAHDYELLAFFDELSIGGANSGNSIGTFRVKSIEMISGTVGGTGTDESIYSLHIFDINFDNGKSLGDALSVIKTGNGNQTFNANIVIDAQTGVPKIYSPSNNTLLYKLPFEFIKSLRDIDNPLVSNTSYTAIKKLVGSVNSSGLVTFISASNETFISYNKFKMIGGLQNQSSLNYDPIDLSVVGVTTVTPTQITIVAGLSNIGYDFVLLAEVLITGVKEKAKTVNTVYYNGISGNVTKIDIDVVDSFRIVSVTDVTTPSAPKVVTSDWELVSNQKDNYYDQGYIKLKTGVSQYPALARLDIVIDYFEHSSVGDFFSVDSYTAIINDPLYDFGYEDIPTYTATTGIDYKLSDVIDFRQSKGVNNDFISGGAITGDIPSSSTNIIFDIGYYLPRIDLLCVSNNGNLANVHGVASINPVPPKVPTNMMSLYNIYLKPYTFDITRDIQPTYLDNKRYTMRDIGKLETRIDNVEYYVSFNLLEKDTSDLEVIDGAGNNRFKNGFLVDNFKNFNSARVKSHEFKCSLDTVEGILRPSFIAKQIDGVVDASLSSHWVYHHENITLPFTTVDYLTQPFASKTVSVNPYFIYESKGVLQLSPNIDVWRSDIEPRVVSARNTGFDTLNDVVDSTGVFATTWGNWSEPSDLIATDENVDSNTTIRNSISRTSGAPINSVNIIPYIRPSNVQFAVTDMLPRTKLYAFFDDVNVTDDCRPINSSRGKDLITDEDGNFIGVFLIPNRTDKRFFTGTRVFRLTNSSVNSLDPDVVRSTAEARYFAGGVAETRGNSATIETSVEDGRIVARLPAPPAPPPPPPAPPPPPTPQLPSIPETFRAITNGGFSPPVQSTSLSDVDLANIRNLEAWRRRSDPLAQSFTVVENDGVFISELDLYFSDKDVSIAVWVELREMINGYPAPKVLPNSQVVLQPSQINTSTDGSVATVVNFPTVIHLKSDTEYCFVVGSGSEEPRLHVSKIGDIDILSNSTISTQPTLGSLFKSQNNKTWTAEQYEDIKYNLKRAKFDISQPLNLTMVNSNNNSAVELRANPFETESGTNLVRIYHDNHGFVPSDRAVIEIKGNLQWIVHNSTGNLEVGQRVVASNGAEATISDIQFRGTSTNVSIYALIVNNIVGEFNRNDTYTTTGSAETFKDSDLLSSLGIIQPTATFQSSTGTIITLGDIPQSNEFNGIPIGDLTLASHVVQVVDSIDTYIIQVASNATQTGRVGGIGHTAYGNIQLDALNFNTNLIDFSGDAKWTYSGIGHKTFSNYTPLPILPIELGQTLELDTPNKIASTINESLSLGGLNSVKINLTVSSVDDFVSPVLDVDTVSFVGITNRVDNNTPTNFNVAPNSTNRWIDEEFSIGSVEPAKYVMNAVNLDNPASNIRVILDVLQFLDSEVKVYIRTLPSESEQNIEDIQWIYYPFDIDIISEHDQDFREAQITIPSDNLTELPDFKSFQAKIVMRGINTAKPPKIRRFRAIAVT